jgi:hypothetical protein
MKESTAKTYTAERVTGRRGAGSKIWSQELNGLSRERVPEAAVLPVMQPPAHVAGQNHERNEKQETTTYIGTEYQEEASTWNEKRRKIYAENPLNLAQK